MLTHAMPGLPFSFVFQVIVLCVVMVQRWFHTAVKSGRGKFPQRPLFDRFSVPTTHRCRDQQQPQHHQHKHQPAIDRRWGDGYGGHEFTTGAIRARRAQTVPGVAVAGVVPASAVCVGGGAQWHAHAVAAAQGASGHLMVKNNGRKEQWSNNTIVTIQKIHGQKKWSKIFMVKPITSSNNNNGQTKNIVQ